MRYLFLLLINLMTACWSFEASESHNQSSLKPFPLLELPIELIPEVANRAHYRDYQRLSFTCKILRDTLKAPGRRIQIVQDITEKNTPDLISALQCNSQVRGIIFKRIFTPLQSFKNLVPTLKTMKNLKELQFNDCHITQELINLIADIKQFNDCHITQELINLIADIKQLEKLTILGLRDLRFFGIKFDICSTLSNLHTLELDTLWSTDFKAFQSHTSLKSLNIRSGYLKDNDLLALSKIPSLTELNLEQVDFKRLSHELVLPIMPQVKSIVNCYNLPSLKYFPNLTKLIGFSGAFTLEKGEQLKNLSNLTILNIKPIHIEDFENAQIGVIGTLTNLTDLNLSSSAASADKFVLLQHLINLQKLDVNRTNFDDQGMKAIINLPLTSLNLCGCNISPQMFTLLGKCQLLQELNLERTQVNMEGMKAIGTLTNLTDLNLSYCKLNLNLNSIPYHQPLLSFQKLNLSYTNINDKGIKIVSTFPNLKELVLSECLSITPEGFLPLHNIITLEILNVAKTQFNETFFTLLLEEKEKEKEKEHEHQHLLYLHNIAFSDGCCSTECLNKIRISFPRLKIDLYRERIG